MDDLISRQAAIRETWREPTYSDPLNVMTEMRDRLEALPSVQPEIIRCKDCEWWDRIDDGPYGYCLSCKHGFYSANWEISIYRRYKEDFFCADGERRTDE